MIILILFINHSLHNQQNKCLLFLTGLLQHHVHADAHITPTILPTTQMIIIIMTEYKARRAGLEDTTAMDTKNWNGSGRGRASFKLWEEIWRQINYTRPLPGRAVVPRWWNHPFADRQLSARLPPVTGSTPPTAALTGSRRRRRTLPLGPPARDWLETRRTKEICIRTITQRNNSRTV